MKILFLGAIHREEEFFNGQGTEEFPQWQAQRGWVAAIRELGHTVTVFRYTDSQLYPNQFRTRIEGVARKINATFFIKKQHIFDRFYFLSPDNVLRNIKLIQVAKKIKPDIILISGGMWNIYPATIQKIKKQFSSTVILLSGVNPIYGSPPAEKQAAQKNIIDLVAVNDKSFANNWKSIGINNVIVLPVSGVNQLLYKKLRITKSHTEEYAADVCFVGSLIPARQKILEQLTDFNLKIWGDIPPKTTLKPALKSFYYGMAYGEKMIKIYNAAKIVINIHASEMKFGGNMRTFEIPACGAFQLIDTVDESYLINGEEVIVYTDISDLRKKIKYYLIHEIERKEIADKGYKRVWKDHTYKNRFKKLLSIR